MTDTNAQQAFEALAAQGDPGKAAFFSRYFKCGPGQYGEGDLFLGLTVPQVRQVLSRHRAMPLDECVNLLYSPFNEARLLALLALVEHYKSRRNNNAYRQAVFDAYVNHRAQVNNWNLVDASASHIVGAHLLDRDRSLLYELVTSPVLWDRRIAVLATFTFIRAGAFSDTVRLCEALLDDSEDLMHKACGWMLREIGKRDELALRAFLDLHAPRMPRTMLRYSLERLQHDDRVAYMARG